MVIAVCLLVKSRSGAGQLIKDCPADVREPAFTEVYILRRDDDAFYLGLLWDGAKWKGHPAHIGRMIASGSRRIVEVKSEGYCWGAK